MSRYLRIPPPKQAHNADPRFFDRLLKKIDSQPTQVDFVTCLTCIQTLD